jgi:hypothetical protein
VVERGELAEAGGALRRREGRHPRGLA